MPPFTGACIVAVVLDVDVDMLVPDGERIGGRGSCRVDVVRVGEVMKTPESDDSDIKETGRE
jgi:hypothetical protein